MKNYRKLKKLKFWKEIFESNEADYWIEENKNNFDFY